MSKPQWYFLSCAKPKFNAGIIVQGTSTLDAVMNAAGLNQPPPEGTEVMGWRLPAFALPEEKYRNRLLTLEELKTIWPGTMTFNEARTAGKDVDAAEEMAETLCSGCVSGMCKVH